MHRNLNDEVEVRFIGKITRIEGDFSDEKVRYTIKSEEHCVNATVTEDQINKKQPITMEAV